MVSVQVLPQVDLPDTAFHRNTAPIVTKASLTRASIALMSTVSTLAVTDSRSPSMKPEQFLAGPVLGEEFLPILLCSLLC